MLEVDKQTWISIKRSNLFRLMWLDASWNTAVHGMDLFFLLFLYGWCTWTIRLSQIIEKDEKNNERVSLSRESERARDRAKLRFSSGSFTHSKWIGFICLSMGAFQVCITFSIESYMLHTVSDVKKRFITTMPFDLQSSFSLYRNILMVKMSYAAVLFETIHLRFFGFLNWETLNILCELWTEHRNHLTYWLQESDHHLPHWLTHAHLQNEISTATTKMV